MDDLVTWFRAQLDARERELDEDERVAQEASPGPWKPNAEHDEVMAADDITVADGFALSNNQLRATVDHIARWDPKRVLREVETGRAEVDAKRRILDEHPRDEDGFCGDGIGLVGCKWAWPCPTVRLLVLPYADRPGFDPAWAESMIR